MRKEAETGERRSKKEEEGEGMGKSLTIRNTCTVTY